MSEPRTFGVWLTAKSAAEYLDYGTDRRSVRAFYEWARRHRDQVPPRHQGRRVLYARADIDRVLNPVESARKLRAAS